MTDAPVDATGAASPPTHRRRLLLLAVLLLLVAVATWTVINALVAAHRLRSVRDDIGTLTRTTDLDRAQVERRLTADLREVESARALINQPGPRVVSWLPILGRNVTAERTVADASAAALRAGVVLTRQTADLGNGRGGVDLQALRRAGAALRAAATDVGEPLRRLAGLRTNWTLPQVRTGVRQARNQLLGLDDRMARAGAGLTALDGVLGGAGSRRVVVGLMNNAELRGSGGLLSAFALGTATDGALRLRPFRDVNTVSEPAPRVKRVTAPDEFHQTYGRYLADTTLWKNVTMSPRADQSAGVLANVVQAGLKVQPDVVVLLDVPAASAIVSATGPVTIDGESVGGAELTRRLLVDEYGEGRLGDASQTRRRQALTAAATQAFDRLRRDGAATPALLRALSDAVVGRHLVVWSARPDEEDLLRQAGMAGALAADGHDLVLVSANNLGDGHGLGNKLDYYVSRRIRVDVRLSEDSASVSQSVTLTNHAPDGLGPYVEGLHHPGRVTELLSMDLAANATLTSFTRNGVDAGVEVTAPGDTKHLTVLAQVSRDESVTYRVTYRLPLQDSRYSLLLDPQPLAAPAWLDLSVRAVDATLGVVTGAPQPVDDAFQTHGRWDAAKTVTVPVYGFRGLRGVLHAVAHFWTHRVSF